MDSENARGPWAGSVAGVATYAATDMWPDYRWELWVPRKREDEAREALWKFSESEFLRGPDLPSTDEHSQRVILYLDASANKKGIKELDEFVTRLASRLDGHAWRTSVKTLHIAVVGTDDD